MLSLRQFFPMIQKGDHSVANKRSVQCLKVNIGKKGQGICYYITNKVKMIFTRRLTSAGLALNNIYV